MHIKAHKSLSDFVDDIEPYYCSHTMDEKEASNSHNTCIVFYTAYGWVIEIACKTVAKHEMLCFSVEDLIDAKVIASALITGESISLLSAAKEDTEHRFNAYSFFSGGNIFKAFGGGEKGRICLC